MTPPIHANSRKRLRLWPGVVIALLVLLVRFLMPLFSPRFMLFGVLGGLAGTGLILVWWLLFSRARWLERLGAILVMAVALLATSRFIDKSIATGAMGMLFPILAIPVLGLAFVAWAVATQRLPDGVRSSTMVISILAGSGFWLLLRTGGFTGSFKNEFAWRWTSTPEQRLLAKKVEEPDKAASATAEVKIGTEWPGFRGPHRDGIVRGVRIKTDWTSTPPIELWHREIGPGWSSFAVMGDLLYTQEQRGEDEVVACYKVPSGQSVWKHRDAARFWESNAGAGPRATPTLSRGRVYSLGGTGIINALDATNGAVVWSRNAASDTGAKVPMWGFAGSPLVTGDLVIVAASGALIAYDIETGAKRWVGPKAGAGYSSPQFATINGVEQVLQLNGAGLCSVNPTNGEVLWEHSWKGYPIVQPALSQEGDIFISVSDRGGTRRIAITNEPAGWSAVERWTSIGLKPYFNDFVLHKGHAFGFDGAMLACIDLADGKRKWKGGRYGNGQLVLLPNQDLLLVLSEEGMLAAVGAKPDEFKEFARFPAIRGKTWNHPVVYGDIVFLRNGEEMAAFRLPVEGAADRGEKLVHLDH